MPQGRMRMALGWRCRKASYRKNREASFRLKSESDAARYRRTEEGNELKEPKRLSLSYEQITKLGPKMLEPLQGMLDDETLARIAHLGRFLERLGGLKLTRHVTDEEMEAIFRDTADPGELWA
jgi:hypothetical protein